MKAIYVILVVLTCSFSLISGQYSVCRDVLDYYSCYYWHIGGMCHDNNYRQLMIENCQKTCNLCPDLREATSTEKCVDKRKLCKRWKHFCHENSQYYKFMVENCQRSCLFCEDKNCVDKKEKCADYRELGYCEVHHRYYHFMEKSCEKSCQICKPQTGTKAVSKYIKEFQCDFEKDECDWSNQYFEDTGDWVVGIDVHGPQTGYNNSGSYLYLDQGIYYYAFLWLPWQLILPSDQKDKGNMCFHFMYQMNSGEIFVHQMSNPTLSDKSPPRKVKYSTREPTSVWTHVKVNVYASDENYLILKGVKHYSESYIAIDNVFFTEGQCF